MLQKATLFFFVFDPVMWVEHANFFSTTPYGHSQTPWKGAMNFTTGNPTEIPICARCNTSRSLEQFSKSQRKRNGNKRKQRLVKVSEQGEDFGNRKLEETNLNVKAAKKGSMCICIPQPFASFLVNGFIDSCPSVL